MLAKNMNTYFEPFRERRAEIAKDPDKVFDILADGAKRGKVIAEQTMAEVRDAIGMP